MTESINNGILEGVIANNDMDNFRDEICKAMAAVIAADRGLNEIDEYIEFIEIHSCGPKHWDTACKRRAPRVCPYTVEQDGIRHPFYYVLEKAADDVRELAGQVEGRRSSKRQQRLLKASEGLRALAVTIDEA